MIPKEGYNFDSVLIRSKRLSWSVDKTWIFVASIIIIDTDAFGAENIPLYQKLKGYECEIAKRGIIKKKYEFVNPPILTRLKTEIPLIKLHDGLLSILNENFHLMESIAKVNPDNLSIKMFNPPIETSEIGNYIEIYKEMYYKPTEIIWNVHLEKYLGDLISKKKYTHLLDLIIEIINLISDIVRKNSHRVAILL